MTTNKGKCNTCLELILEDIPKIITACENGYILTYYIHNGHHPKYDRIEAAKEHAVKLNQVIGEIIDQVHLKKPDYCATLSSDVRLPEFVLTLYPRHNKPKPQKNTLCLLPARDAIKDTNTLIKKMSDISYCAIPSSLSMEDIKTITRSDIKPIRVKMMGLAVCFFHNVGNQNAPNTIKQILKTNSHNLLIQNTI
jgi:hypothetical protein